MKKDSMLGLLYGLLAVSVMTVTYQWLDRQPGLSSGAALHRAEQSLMAYCNQTGLHPYELQLMDETAPSHQNPHWRFQFQSARDNQIWVEVSQSGHARVLSKAGGSAGIPRG